jgi:hypothetical protein
MYKWKTNIIDIIILKFQNSTQQFWFFLAIYNNKKMNINTDNDTNTDKPESFLVSIRRKSMAMIKNALNRSAGTTTAATQTSVPVTESSITSTVSKSRTSSFTWITNLISPRNKSNEFLSQQQQGATAAATGGGVGGVGASPMSIATNATDREISNVRLESSTMYETNNVTSPVQQTSHPITVLGIAPLKNEGDSFSRSLSSSNSPSAVRRASKSSGYTAHTGQSNATRLAGKRLSKLNAADSQGSQMDSQTLEKHIREIIEVLQRSCVKGTYAGNDFPWFCAKVEELILFVHYQCSSPDIATKALDLVPPTVGNITNREQLIKFINSTQIPIVQLITHWALPPNKYASNYSLLSGASSQQQHQQQQQQIRYKGPPSVAVAISGLKALGVLLSTECIGCITQEVIMVARACLNQYPKLKIAHGTLTICDKITTFFDQAAMTPRQAASTYVSPTTSQWDDDEVPPPNDGNQQDSSNGSPTTSVGEAAERVDASETEFGEVFSNPSEHSIEETTKATLAPSIMDAVRDSITKIKPDSIVQETVIKIIYSCSQLDNADQLLKGTLRFVVDVIKTHSNAEIVKLACLTIRNLCKYGGIIDLLKEKGVKGDWALIVALDNAICNKTSMDEDQRFNLIKAGVETINALVHSTTDVKMKIMFVEKHNVLCSCASHNGTSNTIVQPVLEIVNNLVNTHESYAVELLVKHNQVHSLFRMILTSCATYGAFTAETSKLALDLLAARAKLLRKQQQLQKKQSMDTYSTQKNQSSRGSLTTSRLSTTTTTATSTAVGTMGNVTDELLSQFIGIATRFPELTKHIGKVASYHRNEDTECIICKMLLVARPTKAPNVIFFCGHEFHDECVKKSFNPTNGERVRQQCSCCHRAHKNFVYSLETDG